jgi:hypothetical protein
MKKLVIALSLLSLIACKKEDPVVPVQPTTYEPPVDSYLIKTNNFQKFLSKGVIYRDKTWPDSIYLKINMDSVVLMGKWKCVTRKVTGKEYPSFYYGQTLPVKYFEYGYAWYDNTKKRYLYNVKAKANYIVVNPDPSISVPDPTEISLEIEFFLDSNYVICNDFLAPKYPLFR